MGDGPAPSPAAAARLLARRLRLPALFLVGPAVSVGLGALIFGLPADLLPMASATFALSLLLLAVLARAERRAGTR